jgi:Holliday junction resolvase RusA-like endonuclease
LKLIGSIVPKARPRAYKGRLILPANYRNWKEIAFSQLERQELPKICINKYKIICLFTGRHHRGSDLDNLIGSILDVLVDMKIVKDDSLMHLESILCKFEYTNNKPSVHIYLYDMEDKEHVDINKENLIYA